MFSKFLTNKKPVSILTFILQWEECMCDQEILVITATKQLLEFICFENKNKFWEGGWAEKF